MLPIRLSCSNCGRAVSPSDPTWFCPSCASILQIRQELSAASSRERTKLRGAADSVKGSGVWRYAQFIPVDSSRAVSLGEGDTPLVRLGKLGAELGLQHLYAKLECLAPTGSFKDRGSTVLVSKARELGVRHLVEDSSGNAGASIAAYCAQAGIKASIYVPASAPSAKKAQIAVYGAEVVEVAGTRDDVTEASMERCRRVGAYYGSHNCNPFFLEGTKTLAYELAAQFDFDPPEHLVMPVGNGSLFLGAWKGFGELHVLGLISRLPRLHLAQATGCMPIVDAFSKGLKETPSIATHLTVAGGISIAHPSRGPMILKALRESGGGGAAASDAEILSHQRMLAVSEGIFCEPTSAAAFAALPQLLAQGTIRADERIVVAVTGTGLKDVDAVLRR